KGMTPKEYSRLEVGLSFGGTHVTVWCIRHDQHILTVPLAGYEPPDREDCEQEPEDWLCAKCGEHHSNDDCECDGIC
ncbi:MAG: hypothetical protein GTN93_06475, partial [Anaerolineae bacterium]|nr:hypothetical protein [Anaerolineae bacterium]